MQEEFKSEEELLNHIIEKGEIGYHFFREYRRCKLGMHFQVGNETVFHVLTEDVERKMLVTIQAEYPTLYQKLMDEGKNSQRRF
jgi:pheromone shutdown protein TraB